MFFGDGDIDLQFGLSYNLDLPQITPAPWFIFEKLTIGGNTLDCII